MRVAVDREICMAAGVCVMTAGTVFDQDADGFAVLISDPIAPAHEKVARNAVRVCPSGALSIVSQ